MDRSGGRRLLVISSLVTALLASAPALAGPVDLGQVQKVAGAFLKTRAAGPAAVSPPGGITVQGAATAMPSGFREIRGDDGTLLAYVADLAPRGFIALAADTDLPPVIAYSFRSSFPSGADPQNPLYRMLREDLRLRTRALAEHPELRTPETGRQWDLYASGQASSSATVFQQWPPEGSTPTDGWVRTAWDQDAPYNRFCPLDPVDGGRSYVGCGATAVAQITNYHRQCNLVFGPNDAYMTYGGMQIDADSARYDFPAFPELNGYVEAIRSKYAAGVDLNDVEVAALSFACGVSMQMDYSSLGSGAAPSAMRDSLLDRYGFYSADLFGGLSPDTQIVLQENIINRLPALVLIGPPDGWGGHVVVCDGCNSEGQYHLGFGWGADYPDAITEVWYNLPTDFYPHEYVITEAILNIQPSRPALEVDPPSLSFYGVPGQETDAQTLHLRNLAGPVEVNAITSPDGFVVAAADEFSDRLGAFTLDGPAQDTPIRVKFRPLREGGYYGTLAISCNDGKTRYVILKGSAFAGGTEVKAGPVSGTWSQAQSPYFVTGDVNIPPEAELVIEPGVKVFFAGSTGLTVGTKAKLTARGTAAAPIELTAWNRDTGWGGLRFLGSGSDDTLSCCAISWARKGVALQPGHNPAAPANRATPEEDKRGGAVYCYSSSPTLQSCKLTNNLGDCAGGFYNAGGYPTLDNTLVANNTSLGDTPRCGGVCCNDSGAVRLRNCTIVNNSPGGLFPASWDGMLVTNTIVWGNELYQIQTDESWPALSFCDVQGGWPGSGNLDADPGFLRPSAGPGIEYDGAAANWALQSRSPCLNAGIAIKGFATADLAGAPRVYSNVMDLGAYENQSDLPLLTVTPSLTADAGFVAVNQTATFEVTLANTGAQEFRIDSATISGVHGVFSVVTPIENVVLPPGASIPVRMAFHPGRERAYTGVLDIRSTADNAAHLEVALHGVGIDGTPVAAGPVSGAWTKASSPYVVTGDITIPRAKTLTVEPGVTVKFAGHFRFTIGYRGILRAIGTPQDPILFTATDHDEGWYGMRFINTGTDDVLQYCTIEYARKPRTGGPYGFFDLYGGAILCCFDGYAEPGFPVVSSPKIDSCRIANNSACVGGAIMFTDASEAVLTNNLLVDNESDMDGGAIEVYYAFCTIGHNVIANNWALVGGGISNYFGQPEIANNTFVANRPGALYLDSTRTDPEDMGTASIVNNIFWQNEIRLPEEVDPNEYDIRFNDIQGGWPGEGNIDADPLFADPDHGDYHLKSSAGRWDPVAGAWVVDAVASPCIDAGDPASSVGQEPQPHGGRINLGAYGGTSQASKSPGS